MSTVGLLVAALLTQSPQSAVALTRRLGLEPARALEISSALATGLDSRGRDRLGQVMAPTQFLVRAHEVGARDPVSCSGALPCAAGIGRAVGVQYVVALQLVSVGTGLTVDVRLVEVGTGATLSTYTTQLEASRAVGAMGEVASRVMEGWPRAKVEVPPVVPPPTPPLVVSTAEPAVESPRKAFPFVPVVLGGTALAAGVVGVALGVSASSKSAQLKNGPGFQQAVGDVRAMALGADIAYGVALAAGVGAVVTWVLLPTAASDPEVSIVPSPGGFIVTAQHAF